MVVTEIRGWSVDLGEFSNVAMRNSKHCSEEVWFDGDGFDLSYEHGSGYMKESFNTNIPLHVVLTMLAHAGYKIEKAL